MQSVDTLVPTVVLALFAWFGYGPAQDHTEFVSAGLLDDGRTVLFTLHQLMYQPATGWRAFPDGGTPRYLKDVNTLGTYDIQTHAARTLHRERNTRWQPGGGSLTIHGFEGTKALISQSGQLRGSLKNAAKENGTTVR